MSKNTTCSVGGCARPVKCRAMCPMHYSRWRVHGSVDGTGRARYSDPEDSFTARTARGEGGCLLWTGAKDEHGYGLIFVGAKMVRVHRYSWARANGAEVPRLMPVHHKCAVRLCVEPDHLQMVEPHENLAEMLERRSYDERIRALEEALRSVSPQHPLIR